MPIDYVDRPFPSAAGLEKPRFFAYQMVMPADLTLAVDYVYERQRRHNRLLHGWGVVRGAWVSRVDDWQLSITPGYLLGPQGDEIVIDRPLQFDIRTEGLDGYAVSSTEAADPWCSTVRVNRRPELPLYVAVRYGECQTRPVQVASAGCGGNDLACEYSRLRESFAVKVLTQLPASYTGTAAPPVYEQTHSAIGAGGVAGATQDDPRPWLPPPSDPWVILADVQLQADGTLGVSSVDNLTHRRYVASHGDFYFNATP